mmetsp:Transcript_41174/g.66231  ORF Transcript_41174/g.66231 Transcript_41174/m.66231 type:complete len:91 (-) Transcript_41174:209-481(-)
MESPGKNISLGEQWQRVSQRTVVFVLREIFGMTAKPSREISSAIQIDARSSDVFDDWGPVCGCRVFHRRRFRRQWSSGMVLAMPLHVHSG